MEKKQTINDKIRDEIGETPTYNEFYTSFLKHHREEHPQSGQPSNHLISMFYDDYIAGQIVPSY